MPQPPPAAWNRLLARFGVAAGPAAVAFARVSLRYRHPPRSYHTLAHARRVVALSAELAAYAREADNVYLAAWFHDAVYRPGAADNEARSATFAARNLARLAVAPARIREVERLIRLTAGHHAAPGDADGQVLVDADLAILGAPPDTYASYARAIRREYAHVAADAYRQGRVRVLRRLLERPFIYHTPPWRDRREAQARHNLQAEIARLLAS